jgi:SAM-dependent MidA family methyltransferase
MKMPTDIIREEICKTGPISFARFMELALYCPETGYYEANKDTVGHAGDFITSVSVGSLFGELLAFRFAEWLREFEISNLKFQIVEAGAHDGTLARDILNWLREHRPELFSEIEYWILEPSLDRQAWQREALKSFANVRWHNSPPSTLNPKVTGIIFANELLDAFPVRRLGWDARGKKWFEWGVTLAGEKFIWSRIFIPHSAPRVPRLELPSSILHLPSSLLDVLPDGYTIETSPAAESWWREAAGVLMRGKLLAIDYGFTSEEQFSPSRLKGTLRAYHCHRVTDDLLANPGEQDLTAHVNFSAIQNAGEEAGLKTEAFCTQPQFLTRILQKAVTGKSFADWDARRARQFQTLTHPEHLGRAFRVLVQSKVPSNPSAPDCKDAST